MAATEARSDPPVKLTGAPGSGVTADFGDAFSLNLKARLQLRYQMDVAAPDAAGARELTQWVGINTARIYLGGHLFSRRLNYLIQLALAARDYRDGATSPVYDAFLDYKAHRDFSIKAGQYFVPFDRLRTVKESALQMADRPRPVSELTLDRDVGVTAYSDHFLGDDSILAYRVSAFGGGGMNIPTGKTPGALVVGRLELRPLGGIDDDSEGDLERRARPVLAIGGAVAGNWNSNRLRSTTGPTFQAGVVDYFHAAADVVFKWRGFALEGEFLLRQASTNTIVSSDPSIPDDATQSGKGWIVQASYIFETPVELVGRLSKLYATDGTDPSFVDLVARTGQELGGGVNYYFNGHKFKLQADYIARMPAGFVFSQAEQTVHLLLDATL
ncbi:MAG: porin [Deltaproteobacteria bacterium]|nr:porin [Deltaproteobacteria bacterium]